MNRYLFFIGTMTLTMSLYGFPMDGMEEKSATASQERDREIEQRSLPMSNISTPTLASHADEMGLAEPAIKRRRTTQEPAGEFFGTPVEATNSEQEDLRTAVATRNASCREDRQEIPISFSPDEKRFVELINLVQGEGLWQEKLNEETGQVDRLNKPMPFPAHEFLKLFTQIDIFNPKLVESHSLEEITSALEFSFGCLKNDLRKKIADLSQQIAVKDQTPSEDSSECLRLEEHRSQLEELLTTLELYPDINNFDDPVRTDLNNFLVKSEEAEAVCTLEKYDDMERAEVLSLHARASLASALEIMQEGTNRPHIIHDNTIVQQLSDQALEALKKNKREEFFSAYHKGFALEAVAREMAGQNRHDIINGFQEAVGFFDQALVALDQGNSNRASYLSLQGFSLFRKTTEASKKNRQDIINGFQDTAGILAQALVALDQGDSTRARLLHNQGHSLFRKTAEASKKNRQDIINSFQEAAEVFAQALAHNQDNSIRARLLHYQGQNLLNKAQEAARKNRPNIIAGHQEANGIFDQVLAALDQDESDRARLLCNQGVSLFRKTAEASKKNRQDIINGFQEAAELFVEALDAHNEGNSNLADFLDKQGLSLLRKTAEISRKND